MKKFIKSGSILLAIILACSFMLTACTEPENDNEENENKETDASADAHQHGFGDAWITDAENHWHACEGEDCNEISDKAAHQWVDKKVLATPSQDEDGAIEKECSVCGAKYTATVPFEGIGATEWADMLSDKSFNNYTLNMDGVMTVTINGEENSISRIKEIVKIDGEEMFIEMFSSDIDSVSTSSETMFLSGEMAEAQKLQYTQLYLAMLERCDNFSYDKESKTYKIANAITIEKVLKGISESDDGLTMFDVPSVIEMRNAEVSISADGKLLRLVCEYTQTMDMSGTTISTSGTTTWIFSDYGTTLIPGTY